MRLSVENFNLRKMYGDKEALRIIKQAGFDAVDFSCYGLPEDGDIINSPDRREYAQSLREYAESLGLVFNQSHAAFKYTYGQAYTEKSYTDIIRSMEFASYLGIPHIVVHSVKCPRNDCSVDSNAVNLEFYRSLEPYCREYGIKIAVENLFEHDKLRECYFGRLGTPKEMNAFMDMLDSDNFIVCCDVGHAALTGTEPENFIAGMSCDRLLALHIQDNDYKSDRHWLPYLGKLNWDAITYSLGKIGYNGDFTLEILHFLDKFPREMMPEVLRFAQITARNLMAKVEAART